MPDSFESVCPMPPGFVIVSGVLSGDQLAPTDTSTAPHILPLSEVGLPFRLCGPLPLVPLVHSGGNGLGGGRGGEVGGGPP